MDIHPVDGCSRHRISQMLKSRTDERRAAVPLIDKTVVQFERQPVLENACFQRRHLAGDGSLVGLLVGGDASIEGNAQCLHAHFLLICVVAPGAPLLGSVESSPGCAKRRSTCGSNRSKASASHWLLYRVVSWLTRTRSGGVC